MRAVHSLPSAAEPCTALKLKLGPLNFFRSGSPHLSEAAAASVDVSEASAAVRALLKPPGTTNMRPSCAGALMGAAQLVEQQRGTRRPVGGHTAPPLGESRELLHWPPPSAPAVPLLHPRVGMLLHLHYWSYWS